MIDLVPFRNRLQKNFRHWSKWARRRGIECYRLYDRDIPELPFAIDWYGGQVHVQVFSRKGHEKGSSDEIKAIADVLCDVLMITPSNLAFKTRQRQRGLAQYEKTGRQARHTVVREGGLKFEVDLHSYLDTGLFLDHRQTREMVRQHSTGKRMLNLYAYTGSFSVYAASGGAHTTTSVDLSNTYLNWARRNLRLNDFEDDERHELIRDDVFTYLDLAIRQRRQFGLIVLDPPSFSNSKKMSEVLDVQRDHPRLIEACFQLLRPGGELFFSNNRRKFKLDPAIAEQYDCKEITRQTVPDDFARNPTHRCHHFLKS